MGGEGGSVVCEGLFGFWIEEVLGGVGVIKDEVGIRFCIEGLFFFGIVVWVGCRVCCFFDLSCEVCVGACGVICGEILEWDGES